MTFPLLLSAALTGVLALHGDGETGAVQSPDTLQGPFAHRVEVVTDRIHLIYRPDVERIPAEGNVEVVEQTDGLVVIDAGGSAEAGADIVALIRGFSRLPVKYLVYTHWHGDHNLGSPAFKSVYPGIHIISTPATKLHLTDGSEHLQDLGAFHRANADRFAAYMAKPNVDPEVVGRLKQAIHDTPEIVKAYDGAHAVLPDTIFGKELLLDDKIAPVELMFFGKANTDGDAMAWLPRQKTLITGDVVVAPVPYGSESYPSEWVGVLDRLDDYDFRYLIPGHGAVQQDHGYLKRLKLLLEAMKAAIYPLARQGLSLDDVQKRVDFRDQIVIFCGSSPWRRIEFNGFFLSSMIKNVYLEAKGEPIIQGQPFL